MFSKKKREMKARKSAKNLHLLSLCNHISTILESYFVIICHRCPLTSMLTPPFDNKRTTKKV